MNYIFSNAFSRVGKAVKSVASSVLDWNTSTFSGAVDIIVVRKKTEKGFEYRSTPFHVKFGILQVLKTSDRIVNLKINGQDVDLRMRLSKNGFAYFCSNEDWEKESFSSFSVDDQDNQENCENEPTKSETKKRNRSVSMKLNNQSLNNNLKNEIRSKTITSTLSLNQPENEINKIITIFDSKNEFLEKVSLSLCAHKLSKINSFSQFSKLQTDKIFERHLVSPSQFNKNPFLVFDENLMVKFNHKFYSGKVFIPFLIGNMCFGANLNIEKFNNKFELVCKLDKIAFNPKTLKRSLSKPEKMSENNLRAKELEINSKNQKIKKNENKIIKNDQIDPKNGNEGLKNEPKSPEKEKSRPLLPTSEQLSELDLKLGANTVHFSVTSSLQGTQIVEAAIFMWDYKSKIVVTDIDGTITKSDILGIILPNFGHDWAHRDVARLFRNVTENGYCILYLTARLISLTNVTRKYLFGLGQEGGEQLPGGPIMTVPFNLVSAYKANHINNPQDMKIQILRDVVKLFDAKSPFYAGFGNKETDEISYRAVKIPQSRIFIINPKGNIIKNKSKQSYSSICDSVNQIFPVIDENRCDYDSAFGCGYWKHPKEPIENSNLIDI